MDVPRVPAPTVPAPPLPRPPDVRVGADGVSFAMRLAAATPASPVPATAPTSTQRTTPPAAAHDRAVTLGAMLAARAGLATPASLVPDVHALTVTGRGPFAGHATVVAPTAGEVTSEFGMRTHPITGSHRHHDGMDVAAPTGTPVRSITDGTVVSAGDRGGYGLTVEVDHGNGTTTRYAHLSSIDVAVGDRVPAGGHLGAVGSTGASTGPHLHVEVRVDGEPVDPHGLW